MRSASTTLRVSWIVACCLLPAGSAAADQADPAQAPSARVNPADAVEDAYPHSLGMAIYPQSRSVPIDGELSTGGVPLDAQVFMTSDSVEQVLSYYRQDLKKRKLIIAEHHFGPHSGYVGYYHTKSRTMRLATVQTRPGGGSMIVLSAMNPLPLVGKPMEIPEGLPDLPSAINVVTTEQEQAGATHQTVFFEAWGTPGAVLAKLERRARDKGWQPAPKPQRLTDEGLTLTRENKTCIIRTSPSSKSTENNPSTAVTMLVIEEDAKRTNKPTRTRKGR